MLSKQGYVGFYGFRLTFSFNVLSHEILQHVCSLILWLRIGVIYNAPCISSVFVNGSKIVIHCFLPQELSIVIAADWIIALYNERLNVRLQCNLRKVMYDYNVICER